MTTDLIGPWTAEEWCRWRMLPDDDWLQCCGITSNFRDALFLVLRMGGDDPALRIWILEDWEHMTGHGFPRGDDVDELLERFRDFFNLPSLTREPA